jgi:hypothetical protein
MLLVVMLGVAFFTVILGVVMLNVIMVTVMAPQILYLIVRSVSDDEKSFVR